MEGRNLTLMGSMSRLSDKSLLLRAFTADLPRSSIPNRKRPPGFPRAAPALINLSPLQGSTFKRAKSVVSGAARARGIFTVTPSIPAPCWSFVVLMITGVPPG